MCVWGGESQHGALIPQLSVNIQAAISRPGRQIRKGGVCMYANLLSERGDGKV